MKYDPRLILCSRSTIRARLLTEAGYRFVHAVPPFDDSRDTIPQSEVTYAGMGFRGVPPQDDVASRCRKLAQLKAVGVALAGHPRITAGPHTILMGVHTLLSVNHAIEAARIFDRQNCLESLQGLWGGCEVHGVTSVCFLQPDSGANLSFEDSCTLRFGPTDGQWLEQYLGASELRTSSPTSSTDPEARPVWYGLPNGLAIYHLHSMWSSDCAQDSTGAMGLPMIKTADALSRWSVQPMAIPVKSASIDNK